MKIKAFPFFLQFFCMCVRVAKKAKDALEELHCPVSCAEKGRQNHYYYHQDASGFLGLLPALPKKQLPTFDSINGLD